MGSDAAKCSSMFIRVSSVRASASIAIEEVLVVAGGTRRACWRFDLH
jgi:hypothetical protein